MTMKAIDCGLLIDGIADEPISDAVILLEDGIVQEVSPVESVSIPDDAEHVDHSGEVVIPGLIDAHVHLTGKRTMDPFEALTSDRIQCAARATSDLRKLVEAGFTTVRDLGSGLGIGLREAIDAGEILGPRVFTSGPPINQTGGHMDAHYLPTQWIDIDEGSKARSNAFWDQRIADGPDECRKATRKNIREGADLIKITTTGGVMSEKDHSKERQYNDEEIATVTEEAHRVGMDVAAHAQGKEGIIAALENGVDTIEHGFYLDKEATGLLQSKDATIVPTLAIIKKIVTKGSDHNVPKYGIKKAKEAFEAHIESTKLAHEEGVPIALGSDFLGNEFSKYGEENIQEAEVLVNEIGMDEMEAIKASTSVAAHTIPDEKIGSIAPGNYADLVALNEDPITSIGALRKVNTVYKNGLPKEESAPLYREK